MTYGARPTFTKSGATSYNVVLNGRRIGRVGRVPGTAYWWAEIDRTTHVVDAGDWWASRAAAARTVVIDAID